MRKKPRTEPCKFWHDIEGGGSCSATIYEPCDIQSCPFYKSKEEYKASLAKARENFKKRYGYDGYGLIRYSTHYQKEARKGARVHSKVAGADSDGAGVHRGAGLPSDNQERTVREGRRE